MAEMSPLRRRMIEDMTVRNLSPATQRSYVHALAPWLDCGNVQLFQRFFSLRGYGDGGGSRETVRQRV